VRVNGVAENLAELMPLDPVAATMLNPGDTTRIGRALEVVKSTGRTLAQWQEQREGGIGGEVELRALVLLPPRPWLYERCDRRFAAMVEQGALTEVEALLARKLDPNLPVMRAIGVPELGAHLRGEWTLEQAVAAGQQATRRYAKRQYTWFAHQPTPEWSRFHDAVEGDAVDRALALLGTAG
jgi:tRNA dimethylallyltransferase